MNRLKISTRLAISFSTMVLLLVAQGAMVLFLSAAQREAMEDIVQRSNPITKALSAVIDGSNMETIQFRNLALFSSPDIRTRQHRRTDANSGSAHRIRRR